MGILKFIKWTIIIFFIAFVIVYLAIYWSFTRPPVTKLISGYERVFIEESQHYIRKGGNLAVMPTIVDYKVVKSVNKIVGIRLPVKRVICANLPDYIVENIRTYFITDVTSGKTEEFYIKESFQKKLEEASINPNINIDYSKFDEVWKIYSRYYKQFSRYDNCQKIDQAEYIQGLINQFR